MYEYIIIYISYTSYLYLDCRGATHGTTTDPQLADGKGDVKNNNDNTIRVQHGENSWSQICLVCTGAFSLLKPSQLQSKWLPYHVPSLCLPEAQSPPQQRNGTNWSGPCSWPNCTTTWPQHLGPLQALHWLALAASRIKHQASHQVLSCTLLCCDSRFACELHPKIKTRYLQRLVRYSNGISQRALPHSQAADWLWQDCLPAWFMTQAWAQCNPEPKIPNESTMSMWVECYAPSFLACCPSDTPWRNRNHFRVATSKGRTKL